MAKEILYRIEFEGAQEQVNNLVKIREELDQIKVETIKAGQSDKARAEELKLISQEKQKQYRAEQQAIKDSQKEYKAQAGTLEQLRLQAKKLGKELESAWAVGTPEFKKAASALEEVNRKIRNADKSAGNFKSNIGNYAGSIGDAFQGVGLNVGKLTGTLGAATAATNPLGLGLVALASGAQLFGSAIQATDTLSDSFTRTIEGAKAATQVFFKALADGDFSNLIDNMRDAVKVGKEYADIMDKLEDRKRSQDIQDEKSRGAILKLRKELMNVNLTNDERIAKGKEILRIEDEQAKKRVAIAKDEVDAVFRKIGAINQLNEIEAKNLIESIDSYSTQFDMMDRLARAQENLNKMSFDFASGKVTQEQLTLQQNSVKRLQETVKNYGREVQNFGKLSTEERDAAKQSLISYYSALNSFDEQTMRTETRLNSIIKKDYDEKNKAIVTGAKTEQDALKQVTDQLTKLRNEAMKADEAILKLAVSLNAGVAENTARSAAGGKFTAKPKLIGGVGPTERKSGFDVALGEGETTPQFDSMAALDAAGQFVSIWQDAYTSQAEIRQQVLDKQLKAGIISEKKYEREVAKIKTEQAKKEKTAALIQAIINTALGITRAMGDGGLVGAAIAAVIGAIQIGLIASQPVPQYAKGGMIDVGGNSHASGGTKFVGSDGSRFEAERGEVITVVNKRDSARLRALSDLNSEHGRPFYSTPSGNYFASGGMFQPNQNIGASDTGRMVRQIVSEVSAIPVMVSLNEIKQKDKLSRKADVIGAL